MTTAIVTGASRGLGYALAVGLAARGTTLIIDGRDADSLGRARGEIAAVSGAGEVIAIAGDVADSSHRRALIAAAEATGGLDVLINNAGVLGPSPLPALATVDVGAYRAIFEIGAVAPLALAQTALPLLRSARGVIINVTSDASIEPYEGWGAYGSVKSALDQLSRVLDAEEPDVDVYAVDPGDLRTQMHQDAFPGEDISDRPLPETAVPGFLSIIDTRPPGGRIRVANLVLGATA